MRAHRIVDLAVHRPQPLFRWLGVTSVCECVGTLSNSRAKNETVPASRDATGNYAEEYGVFDWPEIPLLQILVQTARPANLGMREIALFLRRHAREHELVRKRK